VAEEGISRVDARALAEVLRDASVRLDDAVSKLKAAGVPLEQLFRKAALEDNNSSCNTACSCGGGGGGGGSGNCVALS
jgi:hypothetical protein